MPIGDFIENVLYRDFRQRAWGYMGLPSARAAFPTEDELQQQYVSIFLRTLNIGRARKWWKEFYPVVHSRIELPVMSRDKLVFDRVTTPAKDVFDPKDLTDRVIQGTVRLAGPTPYQGGVLRMDIGLFAVPTKERLVKPLLDVIGGLGVQLAGPSLEVPLAVAEIVKGGIAQLTGLEKNSVQTGISCEVPRLETGFFLVSDAPKDSVDLSALRFDPAKNELVDAPDTVKKGAYFVLEIRADPRRASWADLPEIAEAWKHVQDAGKDGSQTGVDEAIRGLFSAAAYCRDLTLGDAARIAKDARAKWKFIVGNAGVPQAAGSSGIPLPNLKELSDYGSE